MDSNEIASSVVKLLEKSLFRRRKSKLFLLIGVAAVLVFAGFYIVPQIKDMFSALEDEPPITVINEMTDEEKAELLKHKAIEIKSSVLGEARQRRELLVLERDIQVDSVWESSWGGLDIFKKTKRIVSYGMGYFDIDLSGLNDNHINVDHENSVVTITVPHAILKSISIDESKTEYEDTQRGGMLGFGELKLTAEQQGLLKKAVEDNMRAELEKPEILEQADSAGREAVMGIYQPVISAVSGDYRVDVVIAD